MSRISLLLISILISISVFAQPKHGKLTREEYIQRYKELAISEMKRTRVPASITLAQGCLESGNGNSTLTTKGNNHFGIKCKNSWRGKKMYHDDDEKDECFRKYHSAEDSYIDHSDFLVSNPRYSSLFLLEMTDYKGWARGLKAAGYATDPHYAKNLIKIIEENNLHVYDRVNDMNLLAKIEHERTEAKENPGTIINAFSTRKVTMVNGLKSIVVKPGDTFASIAEEFGMKEWQMLTYNDYKPGFQPQPREILYIEYKPKKAGKNRSTYTAKEGDTMHFIAQMYGIKMKPLIRRNRMNKGEEPEAGQVIYLRKKKPKFKKVEATEEVES